MAQSHRGFVLRPSPSDLDELSNLYPKADDQPVQDLVADVKGEGYLSLDKLRTVGHWKSERID